MPSSDHSFSPPTALRYPSPVRRGEPIPRVEYTPAEVDTWRQVFTELMRCVPTGACAAYRRVMELLQRECGYSPDAIPQLEDVSRFMHREWWRRDLGDRIEEG